MKKSGREKLIDSANDLFYQHGFRATGIEAILKNAGVSKMTLYHHFKSKDDLVLAVLRKVDQDIRGFYFEKLPTDCASAKKQLLGLFDILADWLNGRQSICGQVGKHFRGCLAIRASLEYPDPEDPIFRMAREHKWLWTKHIKEIAAAGGISDPQSLAKDISLLFEGAYATSMLSTDDSSVWDAKRIAAILIENSFAEDES